MLGGCRCWPARRCTRTGSRSWCARRAASASTWAASCGRARARLRSSRRSRRRRWRSAAGRPRPARWRPAAGSGRWAPPRCSTRPTRSGRAWATSPSAPARCRWVGVEGWSLERLPLRTGGAARARHAHRVRVGARRGPRPRLRARLQAAAEPAGRLAALHQRRRRPGAPQRSAFPKLSPPLRRCSSPRARCRSCSPCDWRADHTRHPTRPSPYNALHWFFYLQAVSPTWYPVEIDPSKNHVFRVSI